MGKRLAALAFMVSAMRSQPDAPTWSTGPPWLPTNRTTASEIRQFQRPRAASDLGQINAALGAAMKVWVQHEAMGLEQNVADKLPGYRRSSTGKGLCRHRVDRYARPTAG